MKMLQVRFCLLCITSTAAVNTTVVVFLPLSHFKLVEIIEMLFFPMFVRHNVKKYGNGKNLNCKY